MAVRTRSRVSSLTSGLSLRTRETVPTPTFAWRAPARLPDARARGGGTESMLITICRAADVPDAGPSWFAPPRRVLGTRPAAVYDRSQPRRPSKRGEGDEGDRTHSAAR